MAKILYVEDNSSLRFVTSDQLEKRSYEVVTCDNGIEAYNLFKKNVFDICIFDVMLPEMDGFELAKKIESNIANKFDGVVTLKKEDKSYLVKLGCNKKIHIIPPQIKYIEKNLQDKINKIHENNTIFAFIN